MLRIFTFIFLSLCLIACGGAFDVRYDGNQENKDSLEISPLVSPVSPIDPELPEITEAPRLSQLYATILKPRCADTCHNYSTDQNAGLKLISLDGVDQPYEKFVGEEDVNGVFQRGRSVFNANDFFVVPFDSSSSFLIKKLENNLVPAQANPMPLDSNGNYAPIPSAEIEQIRAWIDAGAQNN